MNSEAKKRMHEEMILKSGAVEAVFINLDPKVQDRLAHDKDDKFRKNAISQTLKETKFVQKLKKAGFTELLMSSSLEDLNGINSEDAIGRSQMSKDQRDLMDFLAKFRKRLFKSKAKIEENKTDLAFQHIQIETMQSKVDDINFQRKRFKDELASEVKKFQDRNRQLMILEDDKEAYEEQVEGEQARQKNKDADGKISYTGNEDEIELRRKQKERN